jgi:UDP-GlcNAc:undecaprenyl-phosphate GlcNAc-1-phosphate transferase
MPFCWTLLAIFALRMCARPIGLVDRPSALKTHEGHVPLVGGLGIAASLLSPSGLAQSVSFPLAMASLLVVVIGMLDDHRPMSPVPRILCQIVAALIMIDGAGLVLKDFGDLLGRGDVRLAGLAVPVTVFSVVGVMNAMNMIDGLDGLAGGIAAVALFWLGLGALSAGLERTTDLAALLYAAVAGFLVFNLPLPWRRRASVFLGDAGSLLLGLVLAWCAVDLTQNAHHKFYAISAVWILGVPLMDTVYAIMRRFIRGRNPLRGDRGHVHHTLIDLGLSQSKALAVLVALSAVYGAIGYFGWYWQVRESVMFCGFLAAFALYCGLMAMLRPLCRETRREAPSPAAAS